MSDRLKTRRAYLTFGISMWVLAMVVQVLCGLVLKESAGAYVFVACLLTLALVFWLWVFRRFTR